MVLQRMYNEMNFPATRSAGLGMKKKLARDKSRVEDQSYDNCTRGA